jgi:hypothetical protein
MKYKPLPPAAPIVPAASSEEALRFVEGLQKFRRGRGKVDRAGLALFVNQFPVGQLQAIARRIMLDLVKGPGGDRHKPREEGPAPMRRAPARRESASQRKGRGKGAPGRGHEP